METLKKNLAELIDQAYALLKTFQSEVMTDLEEDPEVRLLEGELDDYLKCFTVDREGLTALFDHDIEIKKSKFEDAKSKQQ